MPQSDELNNNKVPVSSLSLPAAAPVSKRGRPANSESVKAMQAKIRDEQIKSSSEDQRIEEVRKRRNGI